MSLRIEIYVFSNLVVVISETKVHTLCLKKPLQHF